MDQIAAQPRKRLLRLGQIQLSRAEQLLNIMRPPSARAFPAQPETARRSRHCSWGTPRPLSSTDSNCIMTGKVF